MHNSTWMGGPMAKYWSTISMVFSGMVTFTPLMLLSFVWPTFSIVPKLVNLILTTSLIGKFTFCAA